MSYLRLPSFAAKMLGRGSRHQNTTTLTAAQSDQANPLTTPFVIIIIIRHILEATACHISGLERRKMRSRNPVGNRGNMEAHMHTYTHTHEGLKSYACRGLLRLLLLLLLCHWGVLRIRNQYCHKMLHVRKYAADKTDGRRNEPFEQQNNNRNHRRCLSINMHCCVCVCVCFSAWAWVVIAMQPLPIEPAEFCCIATSKCSMRHVASYICVHQPYSTLATDRPRSVQTCVQGGLKLRRRSTVGNIVFKCQSGRVV